jgi:hypothetical protein
MPGPLYALQGPNGKHYYRPFPEIDYTTAELLAWTTHDIMEAETVQRMLHYYDGVKFTIIDLNEPRDN